VERLAQRLGMGSRQLTRLFARHLRASPSKVARTARVQRAKRLLDQTSLPMTEIAMQAGFRSLRRFNSVFVEVYGRPPTEIRRTRGSAGKAEQKAKDLPFCSSSGRLQAFAATCLDNRKPPRTCASRPLGRGLIST
jgi:AraC-like DNA-binding protein